MVVSKEFQHWMRTRIYKTTICLDLSGIVPIMHVSYAGVLWLTIPPISCILWNILEKHDLLVSLMQQLSKDVNATNFASRVPK